MAETKEMPKSIHSGIPIDAIGEALLQHYNVGISNPWFEAGLSDQETYNRRKLPWAGKNYTVTDSGELAGDTSEVPAGLARQWEAFAQESREVIGGTAGTHENLEDFYNTLTQMNPPSASQLSDSQ